MKALVATALIACAVALAACQTEGAPASPSAGMPAAKPAPAAANAPATPAAAAPNPARGAAIFKDRCKDCHDPPVGDAPERSVIAQKPAAEIRQILKTGLMQPMAEGLSDDDITQLIAFLKSPA